MGLITHCLILFAIVFGVNLIPAFGPPTWSIVVIYGLNTSLPMPIIVVVSALAAALGRFILAHAFRHLGGYMPEKIKRNVTAAGKALQRHEKHAWLALGLFALSPLPSAQLFEAAGLARVRLLGFTAAFFVGRMISYSVYGMTAKRVAKTSLGHSLFASVTSPVAIGMELLMIGLLVAMTQIDWEKHFGHHGKSASDPATK